MSRLAVISALPVYTSPPLICNKASGSEQAALTLCVFFAGLSTRSLAQCQPQWRIGDQQGLPGANAVVQALGLGDPDGAGPLPTCLVATGTFTFIGDTRTYGAAYWNPTAVSGSGWVAMGRTDFVHGVDVKLVYGRNLSRGMKLERAPLPGNTVVGACSDHNNYVWIEHPNGEWTKYTHVRMNSVTSLGHVVGDWVSAGTVIGVQGAVGTTLEHVHFQVMVPDNPPDSRDGQTRVPLICGIPGNIMYAGRTYTAGPC